MVGVGERENKKKVAGYNCILQGIITVNIIDLQKGVIWYILFITFNEPTVY